MLFLEEACGKAEGMPDEHRSARLIDLGDPLVADPQVPGHRAHHELQSLPRVPEIGVLRHDVENFSRDGFVKAQTRPLARRFEGAGRHDDDVVAARAERAADADVRVDVTGRADGGHHEERLGQVEDVEEVKE